MLGLDGPWTGYWLVFIRLMMGWWFLGAGLSKVVEYGLFYDTHGYLMFGTEGSVLYPVTSWFAENAVWLPDLLVPWGQVAIGLGLILGILTRLAAANGAFLMTFFYLGGMGWENGFMTGELAGILLFITIIVFGAGRVWGGDAYLENTRFVRDHPKLRYLMG
ncbi:MAG: DoxX family membrane protein [Halobacteriota archaeon]